MLPAILPKETGPLRHVSASQIKEYIKCPRKWFLNKRCGVPQPRAEHFEVGTAYHENVEAVLLPAPAVLYPSVAEMIKDPRFPRLGSKLLVEYPKNYELRLTAAGVNVRGRIDLVDYNDIGNWIITDWKTKGTWGFFEDEASLARDTQLTVYGKWAFTAPKTKPSQVLFRHGYLSTQGSRHDFVTTEPLSLEHVNRQYEAIEAVVEQMCETAETAESHLDVLGNQKHCSEYKGCPYREHCGIAIKQAAEEATNQQEGPGQKMSLREKLKARQTAVGAATPSNEVGPVSPLIRAEGINPPDAGKPLPAPPGQPIPEVILAARTQPGDIVRFVESATDYRPAFVAAIHADNEADLAILQPYGFAFRRAKLGREPGCWAPRAA